MKPLLIALIALLYLPSAFAAESQAYVFRYTGDTAEGAVVITQGTKAVFYACPVIAWVPLINELVLRTLCKTENGSKGFKDAVIGDAFSPEQKFAFTRTHVSATRYQHGEVSEHLVSSGILTESKTAYFDVTHPEWMFENGITSFVSIDDKDEPSVYSRSGSTFVLLKKVTLNFPSIPSGDVVPNL